MTAAERQRKRRTLKHVEMAWHRAQAERDAMLAAAKAKPAAPAPQEAPGAPKPSAAPTPAPAPDSAASEAPPAASEAPSPKAAPPPPDDSILPPAAEFKSGAHAPKPKPFPDAAPKPAHPMAGLMGGRIQSQECIETAGAARVIPSDEVIYQEAVRRGLAGGHGGQVSMADMARLRVEMAGEPPKPTYQEVCEAAGAVRPRYPIFRR